jgi:hypothetical protein
MIGDIRCKELARSHLRGSPRNDYDLVMCYMLRD